MVDRAAVRNAADPEQVKRAARADRRRAEDQLTLWRWQLSTYEGRSVCAMWLGVLGVYRSVFNTHGGLMMYHSGRQDAGHELMAQLLEADPERYDLMEKEARDRKRRADATTDAAHTPPATEGEAR